MSRSRIVQAISTSNIVSLLEKLEIREVLKNDWFFSALEGFICEKLDFFCKSILEEITEDDADLNNNQRLPIILAHYPGGTSLRVLKHWTQLYLQNGL